MPKFGQNLETFTAVNSFGFSATRPEHLGATEYTLVTIAVDVSASVFHFANEIEECIRQVVMSCRDSPRADNLLLRVIQFGRDVIEFHGFVPLSECDLDNYKGVSSTTGSNSSRTALFDASYSGIETTIAYATNLDANQFSSNAVVFVITDGEDNASKMTEKMVKDSLSKATSSEALESIVTVLIGVNVTAGISSYLENFKNNAGFTQYEGIDATAKSLARLAKFVSRSISSQSQALGTGGPSQALTF